MMGSLQRQRGRGRGADRPAGGARLFAASRRGAAAAEFALVLPVFLLCLFGIIAFATALFIENNMVNAAREAVRQMAVTEAPFTSGAVRCDSEQATLVGTAEYVACSYLTFWGTDFLVDASTECPANDKATVRISVDAEQAALMDIFGFFEGKTLNAEVSMRKEDPCV